MGADSWQGGQDRRGSKLDKWRGCVSQASGVGKGRDQAKSGDRSLDLCSLHERQL